MLNWKLNWDKICLRNTRILFDKILLTIRRWMRPKSSFRAHYRSFANQQVPFIATESEQSSNCIAPLAESSTRAINFSIKRDQRLGTLNRCS